MKKLLLTLAGLLAGGAAFGYAFRKRLSVDALAIIKRFEGLRLQAYQDVGGVWTVGYGATGPSVTQGVAWTLDQAEADLANRVNSLDQQLANLVQVPLTPGQRNALLSLAYNIGINAFAGSTLLKDLNAGNVQGAADGFLAWNKVKGVVQPDLVKRRALEQQIFLS